MHFLTNTILIKHNKLIKIQNHRNQVKHSILL